MNTTKPTTAQVRLTSEAHAKLRAVAGVLGLTHSAIITHALVALADRDARVRAALAAVAPEVKP